MTLRAHQADFDRTIDGIIEGWLAENYQVPERKQGGFVLERA